MTTPASWYRKNRPAPVFKETGPRCPDCGRRWSREQSEAAYQHVMAGCPEKVAR